MIRVGIGGWTFAPWRGPFYPKGLPHKDELGYAARQVTAIEVNGTFYRTQTPATFRGWAEAVPDGFVFALKAHRVATNRKVLAEAGPAIAHFLGSGITELGPTLGPINWQLAPTKRFEPDDVEAFLALLPRERDGVPLRHAIEVRHPSFATPDFVRLARRHGVAIVFAAADDYPAIPDATASFTYARLQQAREAEPNGYPDGELDAWASCARTWERGETPPGFAPLDRDEAGEGGSVRDVFVFFIAGDKVRNPAGALALIERLGRDES